MSNESKGQQDQQKFMVYVGSEASSFDNGNRLITGPAELGQFVTEKLGHVTEESKAKMRSILENRPGMEMKRVHIVYNVDGDKRLDIYPMMDRVSTAMPVK